MSVFRAWMSSLTPVVTRSTSPTLPFFSFGMFSSAISEFRFRFAGVREGASPSPHIYLHSRQKRSGIIELAGLSLGPLIQPRSIDDDLAIWRELHVSPVHRPRRRPFEVDAFAIVSTAMAR